MEGLEIIGRAFVFHSKGLLCFLPLLLLMAALPQYWETLMPTMWHALINTGFFEAPVFAFLLLNCLIVTIIARGSHEEERKGESMREVERGDERADFIAENAAIKYAYDYMNEGKILLSRSCSLDADYRNKVKQEPTNVNLNEKKPIRRAARLTCRGSDKVRLHPNEPLTEKKLMRGSFSLHDHEKPALHKNCHDIVEEKSLERLGHAGNTIDHRPRQAAAAATVHPSLEEVWAAINESNARMACMQAGIPQRPQPQPRPQPAAATNAPSQQPAAAAPASPVVSRTPPVAAAAAPSPSGAPSKARAAAIEKHEDGEDQENDSELEELNRRAEEFIARFNHQMRLQRQESLQRQRGRSRPCNYIDIQYPHHLQLPARGLLVG